MNNFFRFLKDESGATAIEYALIGAFLSIAISVIAGTVGSTLVARFTDINSALGGGVQ